MAPQLRVEVGVGRRFLTAYDRLIAHRTPVPPPTYGLDIAPERIIVTAGASAALLLAFLCGAAAAESQQPPDAAAQGGGPSLPVKAEDLPERGKPAPLLRTPEAAYSTGPAERAAGTPSANLTLVAALFFLPLLDTSLAIVRRTLNGRSLMEADRGHVHHRLLDRGMGIWQVLGVLGGEKGGL